LIVDVVFAGGMTFFGTCALVQCWIYPSEQAHGSTEILWYLILVLLLVGGVIEGQLGIPMQSYLGVSWLVYGALAKALSTFVKYFFQA
jgi:hypothetical protein